MGLPEVVRSSHEAVLEGVEISANGSEVVVQLAAVGQEAVELSADLSE